MEFSYSKYIKAHVDIYLCYVNLNSTLANTRLSLAQLCGEKERNLRNSRVYWNPYVRLQYYTSHSFPSSIRLRNYIEPTIRNLSIIHRFKTHLHLSRLPNFHSTGWLQKNPALSSFMIYHRICNMSDATGATSGTGMVYISGVHSRFCVRVMLLYLNVLCSILYVDHCLFLSLCYPSFYLRLLITSVVYSDWILMSFQECTFVISGISDLIHYIFST